jgi:hypothetical protein
VVCIRLVIRFYLGAEYAIRWRSGFRGEEEVCMLKILALLGDEYSSSLEYKYTVVARKGTGLII